MRLQFEKNTIQNESVNIHLPREPNSLAEIKLLVDSEYSKSAKIYKKQEKSYSSKDLTIQESNEKFVKMKIEIIDSGVGIKKENLEKLFMEFGKLDEHSKINA